MNVNRISNVCRQSVNDETQKNLLLLSLVIDKLSLGSRVEPRYLAENEVLAKWLK